jgi:hypothetical protein
MRMVRCFEQASAGRASTQCSPRRQMRAPTRMGHHMMLDPSFCRLFPGSALLVSVDDETSCAIVCKCALLIGLWRRMGRPVTFLRRPPMRWAGGPMKPIFFDDSELIVDHSEPRPQGDRIYHDLSSATTSVTLAGSRRIAGRSARGEFGAHPRYCCRRRRSSAAAPPRPIRGIHFFAFGTIRMVVANGDIDAGGRIVKTK